MVRISDILDEDNLAKHVENGGISMREHPTLPLRIYNYTKATQYSKNWDNETINCRGLIVDDQGMVVSRGFPKFFNWGEDGAYDLDGADPKDMTFSEKMDGSLGILVQYAGERLIATRGSFMSEQAIKASEMFEEYGYADDIPEGYTALFEIIYPENRIVVDYGADERLVLLDVVKNRDGSSIRPLFEAMNWPHKAAKHTLEEGVESLKDSIPDGQEGFVITVGDLHRVKVKSAQYFELSRIMISLSKKAVWEKMVLDQYDLLVEQVPDEFYQWISDVRDEILDQANTLVSTAQMELNNLRLDMPQDYTDGDLYKEVGLSSIDPHLKSLIFLLLKNGVDDALHAAIKMSKPVSA